MQILILTEVALFIFAVLIHFGKFVKGYEHKKARIAESVIAVVLSTGLISGIINPAWAHPLAIAVQSFALLGTCVGIVTMIIGVGPRTKLDYLIHVILILLLLTGLYFVTFK